MTSQPNMTNALRAARAERILHRYRMGEDLQTSLIDFLADAMHWCDFTGENFHWALVQACRHYFYELNDLQQDERRIIP